MKLLRELRIEVIAVDEQAANEILWETIRHAKAAGAELKGRPGYEKWVKTK